jgi:protein ImuB
VDRIAAVWVPDFPLQALRRSFPELAEAPLAIAAGPTPRDRVVAVSAEAAELGARRGMTAAQVRQKAPRVMVRTTPHEVAAAAEAALADVARAFSPRLKRHAAGEVLLDACGLVPRWPTESQVVHDLLRSCRRVGLEARVGLAGSVGVARVAARHGDAVVVAAGAEAAFLAPLSLSLLEPAPPLLVALRRWGIETAGRFAALPCEEVALRLGPAGLALHRLARGATAEAFVPDPLLETLREGLSLDDPLGALEPFLFVLRSLLVRLEVRLELRGEGFLMIFIDLALEGGEHREVVVRLVAPTREIGAALALARLQLEAAPPGAPVERVSVLVTPGRLRMVQGSLFGPALPAPGKLATALVRLAALLGPDRVGAPGVADSHNPVAFCVLPFVPMPWSGSQPAAKGRREIMPVMRAFRPPLPAHVVTASGRPVSARFGRFGGAVVACAGPYRASGEWWTDHPFSRDDFDVATTDGTLLRLSFDRLRETWLVEGQYD